MSANSCTKTGDVVEAFLTSRKRTILKRALKHFSNSVRKNPSRYKKSFGITSDRTVRSHINDVDELFDDFNIR